MSVVPVLVTVTTDLVSVEPTRLLPKLKLLLLTAAFDRAWVIVREAVAVCEVVPDVPVTVIVGEEPTAAAEALSVNCPSCPGEMVVLAGDAVTPAGRPLRATLTGVLKLPIASIDTASDWLEPPFWSVTALGAAAIEKSGVMEEPQPTMSGSKSRADKRRFKISPRKLGVFRCFSILCKELHVNVPFRPYLFG
jgi:hypothetical protein